MTRLLFTALLLSSFYQYIFTDSIIHQAPYTLSFMDKPYFTDLNFTGHEYQVDPTIRFQCAWNTTLFNQFPPGVAQGSLLFDRDFNTLSCQPFQPLFPTSTKLSSQKIIDLANNMAIFAYLQNGSFSYQFPMQFVANSTFTVPLNRILLSTDKGTAGLPWEVQVFATVLPPIMDYNSYYKNSFTIIDPYSDSYYSWHYGVVTDWPTVKAGQTTNPNRIFTLKNPCAQQVVVFVVPGAQNGLVYFGKSWTRSLDSTVIKWYSNNLDLGGQQCKITGVVGFVRYIVLQTDNCGFFVSNVLSFELYGSSDSVIGANRVVKFTKAISLGNAPLGMGDLASGGSGSWCYLRKNIEPSDDSDQEIKTTGLSDWISVRDGITYQWSLLREPFTDGHLIQAISSFKFNLTSKSKIKANAAYTKKLFTDIQTTPESIIHAYLNPPTSTYYFLYQKPATSTFSLYSQPLSDTLASITTARFLSTFPTNDDPPKRIIGHPINTDIFILGDKVVWLLTSNGGSLKKIFDLRKFDTSSTIGTMIFAQNGTLSYLATSTNQVFRGNSFYGGYIPTTIDGFSCTGIMTDDLGGIRQLSTTADSAKLQANFEDTTYLDLTTTPPTTTPSETLKGYFSLVPFTRKTFMVVEWKLSSTLATFISQFSPADIGRILVQKGIAGTQGSAHIIAYGTMDQTKALQWSSSDMVQPASYITMATVSPFLLDTAAQQISFLTITPLLDNTVTLTAGGSPVNAPYSTVFVEKFSVTDGSILFRGSFLLLPTPGSATALLISGKIPSDPFLATEWKIVKMSSPSEGSPVNTWQIQDHWTCPYEFLTNQSAIGPWDHHMDRGDKWNMTVLLRRTRGGVVRKSEGSFMPNHLVHKAGNPWRLHVRSELLGDGLSGWNLSYQVEEVGSNSNPDNSVTSLSFRMENPTQGCGASSALPVTVISGCLRGTSLIYSFPDGSISDTEWDKPSMTNKIGDFVIGPIPSNYRPPSAAGAAFPTSRILYNADQSKPHTEHFNDANGHTPSYGCTKANPDNCVPYGTCTEAQKRDPFYINCIDRTIYLPYPGDHLFKFHASSRFRDIGSLDTHLPLQVTELNGRTDFSISTPSSDQNQVLKLLADDPEYPLALLYVSNSTIHFTGTGLYHFQVQPAFDYSYCDNSAYFTLWLYSATLPFPMGQVCLCGMALLIALWLFRALRISGESTLIDYRHYSANRPPDRIPLHDDYVDLGD